MDVLQSCFRWLLLILHFIETTQFFSVIRNWLLYNVSQEEMSIFWEVIVSVILSKKCICISVILRTVSDIELFHCTVAKLLIKRYYVFFLISVFIVQVKKKLLKKWYTRRTARSLNGFYHQHKGTSRRTQTSNTPCLHTSCKVHWCWRWNFRKCIALGKMYQICHLNNKYRYYRQYVISFYQQFCKCTVKLLYLGDRSEWDTCTYTLFCLEWPILWLPRIFTFPPGTLCI
jgi:hypothetical protein